MTREDALRQFHINALHGLLNETDHLIRHRHHPQLDPAFSIGKDTGKHLYERAHDEACQLAIDLPTLSAAEIPEMAYHYPTDIGESLDREDLKRLRADIETLIKLVTEVRA